MSHGISCTASIISDLFLAVHIMSIPSIQGCAHLFSPVESWHVRINICVY